jgi:hypothetical protein
MSEHDHPDALLRSLLRSTAPTPPVDDVDWSALHACITTRARPLVRPRSAAWWQLLAGWSSRGIPAAATAAAVAVLLLGSVLRPPPAPSADFRVIEEELAAGMNEGSLPLLLASSSDDEMLDALLFYDEEAW